MAFVTLDSNNNITGIFAQPQPQLAGYAVIADDDSRIAAYNNPPATQAAAAIASGIVLTSTGTPSLNGTYAIGSDMQAQINAVITYIMVNSAFPAGITALPWPDASGTLHSFPDVTHFKNFATAVANFVATVNIYANSNGAVGSIPSNAITIA